MRKEPFDPYKCHFFVVGCVMDEEGKLHFFMDDEETETRFADKTVWNNKFGEWMSVNSSEKLKDVEQTMWHELDRRVHSSS